MTSLHLALPRYPLSDKTDDGHRLVADSGFLPLVMQPGVLHRNPEGSVDCAAFQSIAMRTLLSTDGWV